MQNNRPRDADTTLDAIQLAPQDININLRPSNRRRNLSLSLSKLTIKLINTL